ncbi:MAG: site-specific integrase [Cyanobacteria bacterium P01_A01_bin.123]
MKTINLKNNNGRILIRFQHEGVNHSMGKLGSWDNPTDYTKAQIIALEIQQSINDGSFIDLSSWKASSGESLGEALRNRLERKWGAAEAGVLRKVEAYEAEKGAIKTKGQANRFWKSIGGSNNSKRRYMTVLRGVAPRLFEGIKQPKETRTQIDPFTAHEVQLITEQFEGDYWEDFYYFLLYTGCRTSEAIGIKWENVSFTESNIRVSFALARLKGRSSTRAFKGTKTGKSRVIPMHSVLRDKLLQRRDRLNPTDDSELIFRGPKGAFVNDNDFNGRVWKPKLKVAGVRYRKPYNLRHTFASHCLKNGLTIIEVAALLGNRPDTCIRHYTGLVKEIELPDNLF